MIYRGLIYDFYDSNKSTIVIKGYTNADGYDLLIPEKIDGLPVVKIDDAAFSGCKELNSVSLPDCLQFIGENAFRACCNLEKVEFYKSFNPAAILEIEKKAFHYCEKLLIFAYSGAVAVGERAFDECRKLDSFTSYIVYASKNAFCKCRNLCSLHFGHNAHWESNSFTECKRLQNLYFYHPLSRCMLSNQYQMRFLHGKNIFCCEDFNYIDCAYEGENVVII